MKLFFAPAGQSRSDTTAATRNRPDERLFLDDDRLDFEALSFDVRPHMRKKIHLEFQVNREPVEVAFAPHKTLLEVLREDLGLTGTKHGCELGECGACTVLVDGKPLLSCLLLAVECEGQALVTVEGLAEGPQLSPLQASFADLGAAQCGYCTPAMLLTAQSLLDEKPRPSRDEIKDALSGVLCRCTGYFQIFEAVEEASRRIEERAESPTAAQERETAHG